MDTIRLPIERLKELLEVYFNLHTAAKGFMDKINNQSLKTKINAQITKLINLLVAYNWFDEIAKINLSENSSSLAGIRAQFTKVFEDINMDNLEKQILKMQNEMKALQLSFVEGVELDKSCYFLFGIFFMVKFFLLMVLVCLNYYSGNLTAVNGDLDYLDSQVEKHEKQLGFPKGTKFLGTVTFRPDTTAKITYECIIKELEDIKVELKDFNFLKEFYLKLKEFVEDSKYIIRESKEENFFLMSDKNLAALEALVKSHPHKSRKELYECLTAHNFDLISAMLSIS